MVHQNKTAVKTIIILSNDDWVRVPKGSDPDAYRREQEAKLQCAASGNSWGGSPERKVVH